MDRAVKLKDAADELNLQRQLMVSAVLGQKSS